MGSHRQKKLENMNREELFRNYFTHSFREDHRQFPLSLQTDLSGRPLCRFRVRKNAQAILDRYPTPSDLTIRITIIIIINNTTASFPKAAQRGREEPDACPAIYLSIYLFILYNLQSTTQMQTYLNIRLFKKKKPPPPNFTSVRHSSPRV